MHSTVICTTYIQSEVVSSSVGMLKPLSLSGTIRKIRHIQEVKKLVKDSYKLDSFNCFITSSQFQSIAHTLTQHLIEEE